MIEGIIVLMFLFGIYFMPSIIAGIRQHHNQNSILIINIFLGWTFIGWVVALAMSVTDVKE